MKWKGLECFHRLELVSGPPAKLRVLSLESQEQPLTVYNENKLPFPLTIQLCDSAGNETTDANVKVVLNCDRGIKLTPAPGQQKTNNKGQATFSNNFTLSGASGTYGIRVRALFGKSSIEAPAISVCLQQDPNKPKEIVVIFNNISRYPVGEKLSVLKAHVVADDSSTLNTAQAKDFILKLWNAKDCSPMKRCTIFNPSKRTPEDLPGVFCFRDIKVPEVSGTYCMQLTFNGSGALLESSKMTFTAIAGPPVKLIPVSVPGTPTVSNTSKAASRQLVRNFKLQLQDKFNNLAGEDVNGRVKISVSVASGDTEELPCLQGNLKTLEIPLTKGLALIQSLLIQENTVGKDGQEYVLSFQAQLPASVTPSLLPPFTMPFLFYNDVRKQQQMAQLTKERDHLSETIRAYRSLFETTKQLLSEMRVSYEEALQAEQKLKAELRRQNFPVTELTQIENVQAHIDRLLKQKEELSSQPRRQCLLHPGPKGDKDILGKVGHLAHVVADDVARVLSWHMASDMDCVVTLTTSKAKQVYQESHGQQQVLPLDSIFRRNLPEWSRPLPHVRGNSTFRPDGNPVYARDMVIFPQEAENCKLVFGMLLGDTLILDDLDCANRYRMEVVKYSHCPTILTRAGDRIRSNGKFGGLQNKAPPLERMRGAVFAAPVPVACHNITQQIDQLQAFKQAMVKRKEAHADLQMQSQLGQTEEMKLKHKECQQAETQLRRIEERLGMTPTQYEMPASPATMLTSNGQNNNAPHQNTRSSTPLNNGTPLNTRTRRGTPVDTEDIKSSKRRKT